MAKSNKKTKAKKEEHSEFLTGPGAISIASALNIRIGDKYEDIVKSVAVNRRGIMLVPRNKLDDIEVVDVVRLQTSEAPSVLFGRLVVVGRDRKDRVVASYNINYLQPMLANLPARARGQLRVPVCNIFNIPITQNPNIAAVISSARAFLLGLYQITELESSVEMQNGSDFCIKAKVKNGYASYSFQYDLLNRCVRLMSVSLCS